MLKLNCYLVPHSLQNIVAISSAMFFLFICFFVTKLFFQFSYFEIFTAALLFLVLLQFLLKLMGQSLFGALSPVSLKDIVASFWVLALIMMAFSAAAVWMRVYYPPFPLLNVELGFGWHPDPVFHVSVIRGIMEYGYPSTAQHGSPILFGHYLSHYVDAIILFLLNIDPFMSYGLLFVFKVMLFLLVLLYYVKSISEGRGIIYFLSMLTIFIAFLASTWSVVGSHAMWVTSLLLIVWSKFIFSLLTSDRVETKSYVFLFLIILILSFGKVSVGLMLTTFVSLYLLIKSPKDWRLYVFGIILLVFFKLFSGHLSPQGGLVALDWEAITITGFFQYLFNPNAMILHSLYIFYSVFIVATVFIWRNRCINNIAYLGASVLAFALLFVLVKLNANFIAADIYYFEYCLAIILLLFLGQFLSYNSNYLTLRMKSVIIVFLIAFSVQYFLSNPSADYVKGSSIIDLPFARVNNLMPIQEGRLDILHGEAMKNIKFSRPLLAFKKSLDSYMNKLNLRDSSVLYIPKEIYDEEIGRFGGKPWAKGLLAYAVLGTPLIYGNSELYRGYGYQFYAEDSLQMFRKVFSPQEACELVKVDNIIEVLSFKKPSFKNYPCRSQDY